MSQGDQAESDESGMPASASAFPPASASAASEDDRKNQIRKVKPPSSVFLPSRELEGPAAPAAADILFEGPAPTASELRLIPPVESAVLPTSEAPPMSEDAPAVASVSEPVGSPVERGEDCCVQAAYSKERLLSELRELKSVISGVESLKYLMPRVERSLHEGVDAHALVSFYRIASRTLLEEVQQMKNGTEQVRRELDLARSKLNRKELELAAAEAANPSLLSSSSAPPSKEMQDRLQTLQAELTQVHEQREKLLVDFRNMRDRSIKDVELQVFKSKEKFFKNFLPVLDSFERAQQTMKGSSDVAVLEQGMNLISNMLLDALKLEGLEPVDVSGPFDPRFHEAVGEVVTQEKEDEHVYDELSRGYRLGERLIRPAMIRVARNPSGVIRPPRSQEPRAASEE